MLPQETFAVFCPSVLCHFIMVNSLRAESVVSNQCREKARSHARRSGQSQPTAAQLALLQSCSLGGWALTCAGTTQGVVLAAAQFPLYQLIQIWEAQPAPSAPNWGAQCCSGALQ